MKVDRYVEPPEFDRWKEVAQDMGFLYVASGPLVRSSYKVKSLASYEICLSLLSLYQAGEFFIENVLRGKGVEKRAGKVLATGDGLATTSQSVEN